MEYSPIAEGAGDLETSRGDTIVLAIQVKAPIVPIGELVPVDITGWKMWATVKRYVFDDDSLALAQVTSVPSSTPPGGGIVFTEPVSGCATITIPSSSTTLLPDGGTTKLVYDVQVKDTIGRIFTIAKGTIAVSPDVTRATT